MAWARSTSTWTSKTSCTSCARTPCPPTTFSPLEPWLASALRSADDGVGRLEPAQNLGTGRGYGDAVAERHGQVFWGIDQDGVQEEHHAGRGRQRVAGVQHRWHIHPGRPVERSQRIAAGGHARMAVAGLVVDAAMSVVDLAQEAAGPRRLRHRRQRITRYLEHRPLP